MKKNSFAAIRNHDAVARIGEQAVESLAVETRKGHYSELQAYMAQMQKFSVLKDQPDVNYLFEEYRSGNEVRSRRARDLLVYGNIRLVLSIALRHTNRGLPLLDLIQEGVIGLMVSALPKYDPQLGYRFSTYATQWIRQAMSRAIADYSYNRQMRIPVHYQETIALIRRFVKDLYLETGIWPTDFRVYERVHAHGSERMQAMSLQDVVNVRRFIESGKEVSLDGPAFGNEDSESTNHDCVFTGPPKTETVVEARRLLTEYYAAVERVSDAVAKLPPRTAMVLRLRLGLGEFSAMTLDEISTRYEVTRERIRQVEEKGMQVLQENLGISAGEIRELIDVTQELEVIVHA